MKFAAKLARYAKPIGECLIWTASKSKNGYGKITNWPGSWTYAHRAAWIEHYGSIPDGAKVLHKCDNRACVKIEHLFLGTQQDNMTDMRLKGRGTPKLTEEQVIAIIKDDRSGKSIGADYGVSDVLVYLIKNGKAWRHLKAAQVAQAIKEQVR